MPLNPGIAPVFEGPVIRRRHDGTGKESKGTNLKNTDLEFLEVTTFTRF